MAGQNDKMSAGQDLDGAINHQVWNGLVDMLADKRRAMSQRVRQANRHDLPLPTDVIKIKNNTGGALRLGEVVEIQDKTLTAVKRPYPWFLADTPDETKPFAICLQAIPDGKYGLAQISGCCPALVNVRETTDQWGNIESGTKVLQSHPTIGRVRIMHVPAAPSEQMVWVKFEKSTWTLAALTSTLATGGTATARIIGHNGDNFYWPNVPEITVTDFFFNVGETAPVDTKIRAELYQGNVWIPILYCDASDTLPDESSTGGTGGGGGGTGTGGSGGTGSGGAVAGGAPGVGLGDVMLFGPDNFTEPGFLPQEAL